MEELIFFGVLILFSILDAVLKQRKRQQGGEPFPVPEPSHREHWDDDDDLYDGGELYDDGVVVYVPPEPPEEGEGEAASPEEGASRPWEEEAWEEVGWSEATLSGLPSPADEVHPVHRSHAGYGTRPSARGGAGLPPPPRATTGAPMRLEVAAARDLLRSGDRTDLRTAVVLREILSPPLSMREEG